MDCSRCAAALDHHREAHSSRGANSHQSELAITSSELIEKGDRYARAGCAEWMTDCDRSAHHVESRLIHFSHRVRESGSLSPILRLETAEVRQYLRRECLMHLDQIHVLEREPGTLQCNR